VCSTVQGFIGVGNCYLGIVNEWIESKPEDNEQDTIPIKETQKMESYLENGTLN
jgi:hypothetical protein